MTFFWGEPWFLVLLPVAALHAAVFRARRGTFSPAARLLLATLGVVALARPYLAVTPSDARGSEDAALLVIKDATRSLDEDQRNELDHLLDTWVSRERPSSHRVFEARDSLWQSAQRANASLPPSIERRFLFLTDGNAPPTEPEALTRFVLRSRHRVDCQPLSLARPGGTAIERISLQREVLRLGDTLIADVHLSGSAGESGLSVYAGEERIFSGPVSLEGSSATRRFNHKVKTAGRSALRAELGSPGDQKTANRALSVPFLVQDCPQALLLTQSPEDARFLVSALKQDFWQVASASPVDFPANSRDLRDYQALILYDLPPILGEAQYSAIAEYVEDQGGGLVFVAGPKAFSVGAYADTPIARLLPVTPYIPKQSEKLRVALVLVLDTSGSMAEPVGARSKLDLVRDAARAAAELLKPDLDEFGVIAFAGRAQWVVPLQTLRDARAASSQLSRLRPGGETQLLPGLVKAHLALRDRGARIRHALIMSDGRTAEARESLLRVSDQLRDDGITASCVAVGANANRALLREIAERSTGQYYAADSVEELPQIFTQDIQRHARSGLVEEPTPVIPARGSPFGRSFFTDTPPLLGHLASQPKPEAIMVLKTEDGLPLLTYAPRGLGRVTFFASDAGDRYARLWVSRWESFAAFWAQVVRMTSAQEPLGFTCRRLAGLTGPGALLEAFAPSTRSGVTEIQFFSPAGTQAFPASDLVPLSRGLFWLPLRSALEASVLLVSLAGAPAGGVAILRDAEPYLGRDATPDLHFLDRLETLSRRAQAPSSLNASPPPPAPTYPRIWALSSAILALAVLVLLLDRVRQSLTFMLGARATRTR